MDCFRGAAGPKQRPGGLLLFRMPTEVYRTYFFDWRLAKANRWGPALIKAYGTRRKRIPPPPAEAGVFCANYDEFRFECNECIYEKILRSRGLLKLGAMCCRADVINYGALPYTDFIRTETLCQGGKLCDFRFVRHETDAGNGWERSKSI